VLKKSAAIATATIIRRTVNRTRGNLMAGASERKILDPCG
jgi:hypothetical protein